jgi:hypothetical protein
MPNLHIQCDLTRLGPQYGNQPYFLLTLSVAFVDATGTPADVTSNLQPWLWTNLSLMVYKQTGGVGAWANANFRPMNAASPSGLAAIQAALTAELNEQLTDTVHQFQAADFAWDPPTKPLDGTTGRQGRHWRSWLSHLASWPGGVPTALNLAFVFVPTDPIGAGDIILAAPKFTCNGTAFAPVDPADASKPLQKAANGDYTWNYNNGAVASLNVPETPVTDPKAYIDIASLWRNSHALDGGGDWTRQLDDRLCAALDGVERLLEWLNPPTSLQQNSGVKTPAALPNGFNDVLRGAVFQVVRGAVDSGLTPIRGLPLWQVPQSVDPTLPPISAGAAMPDTWDTIVAQAIAVVAGQNSGLLYPPDPAASLTDFIRAWLTVQGYLLQDRVLLEIVVGLWAKTFGAKWTATIKTAVRTKLKALPLLRLTLLSHQANSIWRGLAPQGTVDAGKELATATTNASAGIIAFGKALWTKGDANWTAVLTAQVAKVMRQPSDIASDSTSDGILIQVDKTETADPANDKSDYMRKVTGAGVLLQGPSGNWRCLNMANVQIRSSLPTAPSPTYTGVDSSPYAVPRRFSYEAGMRQAFLKYVNQPLVARSPWSGLTQKSMSATDSDPVGGGLLTYEQPYQPAPGPWQLERLTYGVTYNVAVFYFANGCALPAELTAADSAHAGGKIPWQFQLPAAAAVLPGTANLKFMRTCRVGQLRIQSAAAFPPALPDKVYPIARAIESIANANGSGTPDESNALVVLLPSQSGGWNNVISNSVTFRVRPPEVDIKVWDRSIPDGADPKSSKTRRTKVIGDVHGQKFLVESGRLRSADTSVDDPAVAGFTIAGAQLWPATSTFTGSPAKQPTFGPNASASTPVEGEQKPGISITVKSAAVPAPSLDLAADGISYVLSVPDGQVWQFDLLPTLVGDAANWLASASAPKLSFTVEVVIPLVTNAAAALTLYNALTLLELDPKTNQAAASASLSTCLGVQISSAKLTQAQLVHRVELITQRWRWDGRPVFEDPAVAQPVSGIPFSKLGLIDTADQDGMLFSNREDGDANDTPTQVEFATPPGGTIPAAISLRNIGWSDKPGLLYYRFAVRAYSRYEGLLATVAAIDSSTPQKSGDPLLWKRYARNCRWQDRVPKPLVKLVLPLTQTVEQIGGTPGAAGWLVVLDEAWYGEQMAGMGEMLASEIMSVSLPDSPGESRFQFGPDPVIDLSHDVVNNWLMDGWQLSLPAPVGAIGATFDTDPVAPLFVRSAFVQPPPLLTPPDPAIPAPDLSFYFVRLRFKRVIAGIDSNNPAYDPANQTDIFLASEFTDGFWTQLLPPSDWWHVDAAGAAVCFTEVSFTFKDGFVWNGKAAKILPSGPTTPSPQSVCRFVLFGLVTRTVTDAFGRAGQEAFVQIAPLDQMANPGLQNMRLRVIEVQFRLKAADSIPKVQTLDDLTGVLFPTPAPSGPPADAGARVVRMSIPLEIT